MTSKSLSIDTSNSHLAFLVKKIFFFSIRRKSKIFNGENTFDPDALDQAQFNVILGAYTIPTGKTIRDKFLKERTFFHLKKHLKKASSLNFDNINYQYLSDDLTTCYVGNL